MGKLYFRVASDWEEVVRLRQEIDKLKAELRSTDSVNSPSAFNTINRQLSETSKKMESMVTEAARAGAKIEGGFKKKIFDASQVVNGLTERIIAQKAVIKDVEVDVKRLGEAYRTALKRNNLDAGSKLIEYNASRKVLDEERAVLFGLTQQQAEARLSVKKLRDEYALYKNDAEEVNETNNGLSVSWKKMLAVIGGGAAIKGLISDMIKVRGEFKSADTAIQTLLGSKEKTYELMSRVREYAAISPLEFSDVTKATQMMLGFNIEAEKVPRYISAIGDISMGNSGKFNSLVLAFSQMSAAGKLMGQDLNQMIGAGFNPLQFMAEKTGRAISELKEEMSRGAITAEMVQQAFIDATSAGGKFFNMSENAAKEVEGQMSMMSDAIDSAFNDVGAKTEGVIIKGIQLTTEMVKNYERIGKAIIGLVGVYGTYRTAIMITTLMLSKHKAAEIALINVRWMARKAQLALNAAMLTNPYVALAAVIAGLVGTIWTLGDSSSAAERAQKKLREEQDRLSEQEEKRRSQIDSLIRTIKDETETELAKITAYEQLQKLSPAITSAYKLEELAVLDLVEANKMLNKERDTNTYDYYTRSIDETRIRLKKLREENGKTVSWSPLGLPITIDNKAEIERAENDLRLKEKKLKEFTEKMNAPKEKKEMSSAKNELDEARRRVKSLKEEIEGLRSGKIQVESDKTVSSVIESKIKEMRKAESVIEALTGSSGKSNIKEEKTKLNISIADDNVTLISPEDITKEIDLHREMMDKYLSEYGTFQQKKAAIEDEFRIKASRAETEGEKLILQKKMEEAIENLDIDHLKNSIDWESVFGNLDKISYNTLSRLKSELKDFISTQQDLSPENMKELVEAIEKIDDEILDRNPFEAMSKSFGSLKQATLDEKNAQEEYNKTLRDGTLEEKKNAASTLENAKDLKQKALHEATDALHKGVEEIGSYVDAGNEVIGIMETLGINTPKWLNGAMSGFGEILSGLSSINLTNPMSIIGGGLRAAKGALSSVLSIGGIIDWKGSNAKEINDSIDRLTSRNEALQTSIESLTDEMKASRGTKSVLAYRSAYDYQKEQNANYLKIAQEQARYHNSHKSWQYYMNWSDEDLKWIQQNVNSGFTGTSSLWSLTPEEMAKLRGNVDIWNKMQDSGKGDYGDRVTDRLDAYIEQAGKLEELTESLNESLTAISFDSMYDSFVNNLMDMKYDAKAAAEDISEYFMRAMLSNKIGEMYSDKLKKWWEKFAKSNEDNNMTEEERKALQDEYLKYIEEAIKLRDELAAATGYDKISQEAGQQAPTRGFATEMTHEDAGELSGRFTALQITGEELKSQNIEYNDKMGILLTKTDTILSHYLEVRNIADESREIIAQSYLELVQISENTGAIVKPIMKIQKDIEQVKRNTERL